LTSLFKLNEFVNLNNKKETNKQRYKEERKKNL